MTPVYGFGGETIRMKGVDADPAALDFNHLPSIGKLAPFALAARKINGVAGFVAAQHAAGIRAMGGDDLTGAQANISEKPFVTLHEYAGNELRGEMHIQFIAKPPKYSQHSCCSGNAIDLPQRAKRRFFCLSVHGASVVVFRSLRDSGPY